MPWCCIATFILRTVSMCPRGYGSDSWAVSLPKCPKPTPAAPFRGSLVDDKMFSIDVKEWGMEDILRARRMARQKRVRKIAASDKFVASIRRKDMTA